MSTRDRILVITAKIIASEGLDAASIRNVCDKAGVKAPTVYYYFKDKDGLIEEVVRDAYIKYAKIHHDYVKNKSYAAMLIEIWDVFFEFVERETDLFHAIVIAHLKQRIPNEGYQLFNSIVEVFKKLEEQNKLKLPFETSAQMFYSTAYGMALVYISQGKNPNLKKNILLTRDLCIRGLMTADYCEVD